MLHRYNESNNRPLVSKKEEFIMNKLIRLLSVVLAVAMLLGCSAFAEEAPRAIKAFRAPADISIDGDLTEWNIVFDGVRN